MCEHIESIEKEQSPARVKPPPQTRRTVIRAESVETQDYVSEPQGLEGIGDEEMEELSFIPSAASRDGPCTCATTHAMKRVSSATNLRPLWSKKEEQRTRSTKASNVTVR